MAMRDVYVCVRVCMCGCVMMGEEEDPNFYQIIARL
jgi:hypothetical protein